MKTKKLSTKKQLYILPVLLAVCSGCMGPYARPVQSKVTPNLDPRLAGQVEGAKLIVDSGNQQAADTLAVAMQPKPMTASWSSNQPGDAIMTGLQISYDLVNWTTLCETNPFEDCVNVCAIQPTQSVFFLRTFNRPL